MGGKEFGPQDLFVLEAGSNSFELCRRLHALGLRAVVLESCRVGERAKTYADNDKMAAARIALVYLAGNAPCVWVPDEQSRQRRELLHAYGKAVSDTRRPATRCALTSTATPSALPRPTSSWRAPGKGFLNDATGRPCKGRSLPSTSAIRMPRKSAANASTGSSLSK